MTKQEFMAYNHSIGDLIEICNAYGLCCCENVMDSYEYNDKINSELEEGFLRDWEWVYVRDYLCDLPTGCDWYIYKEYNNEYCGLTDTDIENIKDEIFEIMEDRDLFDEEAVEDDEERTRDLVEEVEPTPKEPDEIEILEDELMLVLAASA